MSKKTFFQKIAGIVRMDNSTEEENDLSYGTEETANPFATSESPAEIEQEGELSVDVYQTPNEVVVKTMVAGVRPEDLDIMIGRDTITLRGKRESERIMHEPDYVFKELFWGSFSRTISLPTEVNPDEADAQEKNGLLVIRLPKIDKNRQKKLRVKPNN